MNEQKYRWLLYSIITVIVGTIGIQVFWNYKNYLSNKQQLVNDVQSSLDKAVDNYYALLAERTTIGFEFNEDKKEHFFKEGGELQHIISQIDKTKKHFKNFDNVDVSKAEGITVVRGKKVDSIITEINIDTTYYSHDSIANHLLIKSKLDNIKMLTSKVVLSINNDTLNLKEVDSLLNIELKRKNIDTKYELIFKNAQNDVKNFNRFETLNSPNTKFILNTFSKSTFLPEGSELNISFTNDTVIILKRILGGVFVSLLLILAVIFSLFYLLKIIKEQKQLAEVKNDLISNITHEFKTPIATIGVAIESIKDFNTINDKEKTKTYLDMSNQQLSKLNVMVEKLLETATLDSDSLELNKERYNINQLLEQIVDKHKMQTVAKTFGFKTSSENIMGAIDIFHFDNALNNILDNAVKYGGDKITVNLNEKSSNIIITISDNGNTLTKANKDQIFEKFYRISKGNTHDVKGFGIGLYYTKKIVEKHNGTIDLELHKNETTFKISIPK
ncbi:HAMP domain-containing histidine kinase [Seonamhaeicola sp. MEBiC1930]|uniref:sensor histidine kinase n=1 Tax=Seonamhaeicola sp. MEBiC01930 TaxID=2976768 RepID=UPI003246B82B